MKLGYDKAIYKYQDWEKHNYFGFVQKKPSRGGG